jgi:hypothetical protein
MKNRTVICLRAHARYDTPMHSNTARRDTPASNDASTTRQPSLCARIARTSSTFISDVVRSSMLSADAISSAALADDDVDALVVDSVPSAAIRASPSTLDVVLVVDAFASLTPPPLRHGQARCTAHCRQITAIQTMHNTATYRRDASSSNHIGQTLFALAISHITSAPDHTTRSRPTWHTRQERTSGSSRRRCRRCSRRRCCCRRGRRQQRRLRAHTCHVVMQCM